MKSRSRQMPPLELSLPNSRWLPTSGGCYALVDDTAWEMLAEHNWQAYRDGAGAKPYVYRYEKMVDRRGYRRVWLHRELLGITDPNCQVIFVNGNTLDCRASNLCPAVAKPRLNGNVNPVAAPDGSKWLPLTQGQYALVDAADYDKLVLYRWHAVKARQGGYYVYRCRSRKDLEMHPKSLALHRELIGPTCAGLLVDHINGNPLDNRRANLRIATPSQNCLNRKVAPKNQWGYLGVAKHGSGFRGVVRLGPYCTGYTTTYRTPQDAAAARDAVAKSVHGEFALLNKPAVSQGTTLGDLSKAFEKP